MVPTKPWWDMRIVIGSSAEETNGVCARAMEAGADLVPFFVRNTEESRFNLLHEIFHWTRLYRVYELIVAAKISLVSRFIYLAGHILWSRQRQLSTREFEHTATATAYQLSASLPCFL